jgi:hypothetical protein
MITKRKVLEQSVNNTFTQYFGGYKMYWKLYGELIQMRTNINIKTNIFEHIYLFLWFCLLKPLGCLYKYKIKYNGDFTYITDVTEYSEFTRFINNSVVKSKIYYLFGLPFWYTSTSKLTEEDKQKLIN